MLCLAAAAAAAADGTERLLFHGPDALAKLTAVAVGQGIDGVKASDAVFADGRVVWKAFRDETDDLGMRHVFYRQHLIPGKAIANTVEEPWASNGIRILGGEVGLHYRDGRLVAVFGKQHRRVTLVSSPVVGSAGVAFELANAELVRRVGFDADVWFTRPQELLAAQRELTLLVLSPAAGGSLRFEWRVPSVDSSGTPYMASLDAATGVLLAVGRAEANSKCEPDSSAAIPALALPENTSLPSRMLSATAATTRPGWQFEAHSPSSSVRVPPVEVYMGRAGGGTECSSSALYVLTPIRQLGPMGPVYAEYGDTGLEPEYVPGHAAGDAMYHTLETMEALRDLGWSPGSALGTAARLVVDSLSPQRDNASFPFLPTPLVPSGGVQVMQRGSAPLRASAALDVVAHEWGHAVVHATAQWDYATPGDNTRLHEGFADVVAHAVEWARPQSSAGLDWEIAEDVGAPIRDVSQVFPGHSYHALHTPVPPPNDRQCQYNCGGHPLPVAFRLLAVGGRNPLCPSGSCPAYPGAATVVPALGVDSASRVLLRTLTRYATSTTTWEDLPLLARIATFDLFAHCPTYPPGYSAEVEQDAVAKAFTAIGYASEGYLQCVYPDQQQP